jgi:protein Tex
MNEIVFIKKETDLEEISINNALQLLEEGATIPFIARYRKERTRGLDELQITQIRDASKKYKDAIQRQQFLLKTISDQGKLTDNLKQKIVSCFDSVALEDLYLPYKVKRVTRGEKAKKLGLEPLAKMIMAQKGGELHWMVTTVTKSGELSEEDAVQGAKDIIAEWINEHEITRSRLRQLFQRKAILTSKVVKGKTEEGEKYKDYFEFSESLNRIPSHRFLAIFRGEKEGVLNIKAQPLKEDAIDLLESIYVKSNDALGEIVKEACKEAYTRLLSISLENDVLQALKLKSDKEAIKVFAVNLKQLLLASPLGAKRVLAIDPGFRTGCKVVCLDEQGNLLNNCTIYPHPPQNDRDKASSKIAQLVQMYKIEAIAIGDATAGRETENLIRKVRFDRDLEVYSVREDGASIYSASPIARKEFPDYDVTVRGAVSIGRRLLDPLSELVKIDPKSIGVGQYQHEVNQNLLKESLDDVVISAVNTVGVDVNLASPYLLQYVSGLGPSIAENIVKHRAEFGSFKSRKELLKVKSLGAKSFEQAAGFLRIQHAEYPLDNSAVHPESYPIVEKMANKLNTSLSELIGNKELIERLKYEDFKEVDSFTFQDLIDELKKPGRDPRKKAKVFEFESSLKSIDQLKVGMKLPGIVTNVTDFGAFVNIGIKENGLIHKSQLADVFVVNPSDFISLHEQMVVEVVSLDIERKRIGLKKVEKTL